MTIPWPFQELVYSHVLSGFPKAFTIEYTINRRDLLAAEQTTEDTGDDGASDSSTETHDTDPNTDPNVQDKQDKDPWTT